MLTRLLLLCWLALAAAQLPKPPQSPRPTQAQVARRFLREVLAGSYQAAYARLAPEVRATLRPAAFATAAQPLQLLGQQRGTSLELYKLGTRLSGRGRPGQWFYSFSFASDSLQKPPPVLLEVTFRDTTARQILGFASRRAARPASLPRP